MAKFTFVLKNVVDKSICVRQGEGDFMSDGFDRLIDQIDDVDSEYIIIAAFEGHHKDISEEVL